MMLDEPTVGLDPVLRKEFWDDFHRWASEGATLVVSSHVMDEAERCDRLVLLRDGRVLANGSPQELLAQTGSLKMEDAFLTLAGQPG
jgi:ABC-type multidrug transport system ATPase subunit